MAAPSAPALRAGVEPHGEATGAATGSRAPMVEDTKEYSTVPGENWQGGRRRHGRLEVGHRESRLGHLAHNGVDLVLRVAT